MFMEFIKHSKCEVIENGACHEKIIWYTKAIVIAFHWWFKLIKNVDKSSTNKHIQ